MVIFCGTVEKKAVLFLFCLCFLSLVIFAQEKGAFSLGGLVEANANTRHGYGLAGGLTGEFDFTDHIAAGIKGDYGTDFFDVSSVEAMGYARYYFINTPVGFPLFVQLGGGLIGLFEGEKKVFSGLADGSVGIRFPVKNNLYTEQYLRFGWPTGFGFGLAVGYRFRPKKPPVVAPPPPEVIEEIVEAPEPPSDIEIYFIGFSTNFDVIGSGGMDILTENIIKLGIITDFLKENPSYTITIIGHANPVEGSAEEENTRLIPLSQRRAEFIKGELKKMGVEENRMFTQGMGGRENANAAVTNRRVSFEFDRH